MTKKYLINCPSCGRLDKTNKPLNDLGKATLKENEYLIMRCSKCQHLEPEQHEKDILVEFNK